MSDNETILTKEISKYVSNLDRDIYTVSNIPEEVIAVIFAYVSRSPKSFRENIETVIKEEQHGQERASKFHEKWVLNYGHASVAEHAAIHVGIENVSRLFSSILELSNEYLSFTEYSQRYQKPKRGDYFTPVGLESVPGLKSEFSELCNKQYDIYCELNEKLFEYLKKTVPVPDEKDRNSHHRALEKIAFEDARYALNLSTHTNLGMTGNARAIEDSLSKLLSSRYPEVRKRAEEIKEEVRFSAPTLVKYANENKYLKSTRITLDRISEEIDEERSYRADTTPFVKLLDWTGKNSPDPEREALILISGAALYQHSETPYKNINKILSDYSNEKLLNLFNGMLTDFNKHDNPVNVFRLVQYQAEFNLSEACWHQLLRHRKTNWIVKEPSVKNGFTVPPNIRDAGLSELLHESVERSEAMHTKFVDAGIHKAAPYVITNAHNRSVIGAFDLWELYHLVNLRMSEGAQWDIKNVTGSLAEAISRYHPNLISPAIKRVD